MRAKKVNEEYNEHGIPHFDVMYELAPSEIKSLMDACDDTPQSANWHPEGCVGIHNRIVYDRAAASGDINLAVAALFHDLGKVKTTAKNKKGNWSAHGHEMVSAKLVKKYPDFIEDLGADPEAVYQIVANHMRVKQMDQMRPVKQEALRKNPYFKELQQFTHFDNMKTLKDDEFNRYK